MSDVLGLPWLQTLSAAALVLSVWIYVLLDGTDLGTGMLCGLQRDAASRKTINLSLLPVWDGNETWLVLAAGGLFGLFPLAYAIILSALYVPVFVMLLALVVRGMAIEYRHHAPRLFDAMLVGGSLLASLAQGTIVGCLIEGIPNDGQQFNGTGGEWFSPFPLYCALALVVGYCLMGAGWLNWRCTGALQQWGRRAIVPLGVGALTGNLASPSAESVAVAAAAQRGGNRRRRVRAQLRSALCVYAAGGDPHPGELRIGRAGVYPVSVYRSDQCDDSPGGRAARNAKISADQFCVTGTHYAAL